MSDVTNSPEPGQSLLTDAEKLKEIELLLDFYYGRWGAYKSELMERFGFEGKVIDAEDILLKVREIMEHKDD